MDKPKLLTELFYGYTAELSGKEYDVLKNKLIAHSRAIKGEDISQLSKDVIVEYPEFQILHDAYIRKKTDKIAASVSTIKMIAIIYFICSVLVAISFVANS